MKEKNFSDILTFMRLQSAYINQISKLIYSLYTDLNIAGNTSFQEFTSHFHLFMLNHASSEGFSKAIVMLQTYNYVFVDKLLSTEVLSAAEHLELAINHLEMVDGVSQARTTPHLLLLNHSISLLEETQLKIIETLENMLESSCKIQLQN